MENAIEQIINLIPKEKLHKRFLAVKLLEDDERFNNLNTYGVKKIANEISQNYDVDLEETIATERYNFIAQVKKQTVTKRDVKESISDKLDKILLNKWFAFPIFIVIMFLVYYLSVGVVGRLTVDWIATLIENLGNSISKILINIGTSKWVNSLVVDGIIAGVGAVLSFIPQLIMMFICISVLETTGYMPRISLLLDKVFRKIGLSGKSLIPFIIGSGCSVPGIMGTRIIENEDERKMTTILTPFIPCSAKLPIIALFSGYFFGKYSGLVSVSLYFLAIVIIVISASLMKKYIFKNTTSTYIVELPEYKLPSVKYVAIDVWDKVIAFIKRAGSVILICSIVIWFLLSFSFELEYGVNIEKSILASFGKAISWVFYPMLGENSWGAAVSAIQGLVAKEQVISSMSVIAGFFNNVEQGKQIFEGASLFNFFTSASAYAFMVFNLFSAPCFGAIGAMRKELGGTKKVLKAVAFQTIFAWMLATIVYQIGHRIESATFNIIDIIIVGIVAIVTITILTKKQKVEQCRVCQYCSSCKNNIHNNLCLKLNFKI